MPATRFIRLGSIVAAAAASLAISVGAAIGAANDLMPGGSWIASCGNARTVGLSLIADCKRIDGIVTGASLDLRQCASPPRADNINGELRCIGMRVPLFPGSWSASCVFETMRSDGLLDATCFANNTIFLTTFNPKTCNEPAAIGFQGGQLFCENGVRTVTREVAPAPKVATSPPATRTITPAPTQTPEPPPAADDDPNQPYAGEWDIVTERGDRFLLTAEQTGNAFVGTVPFGEQRLQMNGVVGAEKKLTLVWQIGNLAGTGELSLSEDGKTLQGVLQSEGGPIEGGTWTGTRPGSGPIALPLGEPTKTASLPQTTAEPTATTTAPTTTTTPAPKPAETTTPADGFQTATVASAVSIRDKPRTQSGSKTIGSITAGTTVSVRCDKSWCELADGRGWVWKDPLRFGAADSGSGGTTTVPKTASAPANFAGTWQYTFSGANRALATYNCIQSGNAVECSTSNDGFSGTASGRVFTASEGGATMRVTLDASGNKLSGTTTGANGDLIWNISATRVGANTADAPVRRQLEPVVPEQQDKTRFGSNNGVSLDQMLDGLFNRRRTVD